jgi:hypothetical protein
MIFGSHDYFDEDFREFAKKMETDPVLRRVTWSCRAAVIMALKKCPDVVRVIQSGSLARDTGVGPIHDIDLIVVFREQAHQDWKGAGSAASALNYLQVTIGKTLQGGLFGLIRDTELRNHVVKATSSSSVGQFVGLMPDTPPIDVMPAIQVGSRLSVPERLTDRWIETDPERLIKMVEARQRQWSNFNQVVKMIKVWAGNHDLKMKSLAVEAMVLKYLPQPGLFESMSCTQAVARFFEAARDADITGLKDPCGLSGEIDKNFNYGKLRDALKISARDARAAVEAELAWENRHSARESLVHPAVHWRKVFGKDFPVPDVWYWSPGHPEADPFLGSLSWFTESAVLPDTAERNREPYAAAWESPEGPGPDGTVRESGPWPRGGGPTGPHGAEHQPGATETDSLEKTIRTSEQQVPERPVTFGKW